MSPCLCVRLSVKSVFLVPQLDEVHQRDVLVGLLVVVVRLEAQLAVDDVFGMDVRLRNVTTRLLIVPCSAFSLRTLNTSPQRSIFKNAFM